MLILSATTEKLQIVSSAAVALDVVASYVDLDGTSAVPDVQATAFTTATTLDVVAAPSGTARRNVKEITTRNKDVATASTVTVLLDVSGTDYELYKVALAAGQTLQYVEGVGFFVNEIPTSSDSVRNVSTVDQGPGFAVDTYLTGSNLLVNQKLKVGSMLRWRVVATKTAAGTATPIWIIRFGTSGSISDTARCTMTSPAQTAASDTAIWEVFAHMRAVGASGVCVAAVGCMHLLDATGFSVGNGTARVTSGAFDVALDGTQVGLSVNGGSSAAWTVQQVESEAFNLAP